MGSEMCIRDRPIHAVQTTGHPGELPPDGRFIQVEGDHFILTCMKRAEEEAAVLIRGYQEGENAAAVILRPGFPVRRAVRVTLEELPLEELRIENGCVCLPVRGKEIVSVMLYQKDGASNCAENDV